MATAIVDKGCRKRAKEQAEALYAQLKADKRDKDISLITFYVHKKARASIKTAPLASAPGPAG